MNGGHYLKKTTGDALPSQVACIGWIDVSERADGTDNTWKPGFLCGQVIRYRIRDGKQCCRFSSRAATAGEVLMQLERLALDGSLTWVFTLGLRQWLAVSGFWDQVLQGRIDLWGEDRGRPQVKADGGKRKWKGYAILENPPCIVCCRFKGRGGTLKIVDMINYNVNTWERLHERGDDYIGLLETDVPERGTFQDVAASRAEMLEAWQLETSGLARAKMWGTWQTTAASQAQYTYRRNYLEHDILAHQNAAAKKLERAALFAGRCEAYYLGRVATVPGNLFEAKKPSYETDGCLINGKIYHLDVNSQYPYVAATQYLPARLDQYIENPGDGTIDDYTNGITIIADVTVKTDTPCLPFRREKDTIFPVGTFRTSLCHPELLLALRYGKILKCHSLATYYSEPLFHRFSASLWDVRQQYKHLGYHAVTDWLKQMSTGVFGKFAQRSKRWVECPDKPTHEPFDLWAEPRKGSPGVDEYRAIAWEVSRLEELGEHPQSVPSITAFVNSYARVNLWNLMICAGRENVFYVDTDSLWVTKAGFDALNQAGRIEPKRLGGLKIAGEHNEVEFRGIKYYVADGWRVCAGIPPGPENQSPLPVSVKFLCSVGYDLARQVAPSGASAALDVSPGERYKHGQVDRLGRVHPIPLNHEI